MPNTANIFNVALSALPQILALIRSGHPDEQLTDAQVFTALQSAIESTLAKDDAFEADIKKRNQL